MDALTALIVSIPPTIMALAGWRKSKQAAEQTNGMLHSKLDRMETTLNDLASWQSDHVRRWHNN